LCQDLGQRLGKIFRYQSASEAARSVAVHPDGGAGGVESRHALGEKARCDAGKYIARSGGGEPWGCVGVDRGTAIGSCDDGVGALEDDDRACVSSGCSGPLEL
jgi:hypothetical protein